MAQTVENFLTQPQLNYVPSHEALPPALLSVNLIAGQAAPILPHQALAAFTAPNLADLPPISSLFNRARTVLTRG